MTNEEVEAARNIILMPLRNYEPFVDLCADVEVAAAIKALGALCEAAREPENTHGFDDWLDASPEWVDQIDRLEDTGHRQLVRRAMQAAWGAANQPERLVGKRVRLQKELCERASAEETKVMRELCEAAIGNLFTPSGCRRWLAALVAYRTMKGENNANHD